MSMSDIERESSEEDDDSPRTFDKKVGVIDGRYKLNFIRDQSIANLEKQVKRLNNLLEYELSLVRKDFADLLRNLRIPTEQPRNDATERLNNTDCELIIESPAITIGPDPNEPPSGIDCENNDVVNVELSTDSIVDCTDKVNEKTVPDYEAMVAEKDEKIMQLRKQITINELRISEMGRKLEAKNNEVINLKYLLKQANKKLKKRLEHMKLTDEHLTQLINEVKEYEVKQTEDVHDVAKNMKTVVSSLADIKDHIYHVNGTRENYKTDKPLSDCLARLKKLYEQMCAKLFAKPVAARLFQDDVLSLAELEEVQCSRTLTAAAGCLVEHILRRNSDVSYNYFLSALKATNQGHILLWLNHDDFNIHSQHTNLIRQKYTFILERLNLQDPGLIAILFKEEVIDLQEKDILVSGDGTFQQAERLLSILSRKSEDQFEQFLVALDRTGQGHIANELRHRQPSVNDSPDTHVIAASKHRKGNVMGVTVRGHELFVVRYQPKGLIEVYNTTGFAFDRNIRVTELERGLVYGLTSCDSNNCLYISYWLSNNDGYISRVELTGNNKFDWWKVNDGYWPRGLSVNSEHNLTVACGSPSPPKLLEYTTRGELVRVIHLQDDVGYPQHAIQLNSSLFLVSHGYYYGDSLHRVCIVDFNGRVSLSFGDKRGSGTEHLNEPRQLVVSKNGSIFVADRDNHRIIVLDKTLKWSRDLQTDGGGGVKRPSYLYLDERRNLLLVGECNGDVSRVVIVRV